jgi:hypothetical protein
MIQGKSQQVGTVHSKTKKNVPTQLKETKLPNDSYSIKRSDTHIGIQMCKTCLISQSFQHQNHVKLARVVEVPVFTAYVVIRVM